jgi:Carboxypeptidase regulatory-like domain
LKISRNLDAGFATLSQFNRIFLKSYQKINDLENLTMAKKSRLDSISVPKPCSEDWNKMSGGEKSRFCGVCEKNVYNISAMTAREADKLLFENTEKVCIRMEKDVRGKVKTLKSQLHQITRQAPIAAGVLSVTLAFSAVTLAQGEPIRINPAKVNIVQTTKDDASKPIISGTVYDEKGAVVQNVNVILRNVKNNSIQKAVSSRQGDYQFTNVEPSVYEIETDGERGFKKFAAKNIEVSGKHDLRLDMILQIESTDLMGDVVIVSTENTVNKIVQTARNTASEPRISGTVLDSQGAVIPGIMITLRDLNDKFSQKIVSDTKGEYQFSNVKVSSYEIEIEQRLGFKRFSYKNITVDGNNNLSLNIALESLGEVVGVFVEDREIELPSAKVEDKLNLIDIQKLPTLNRKYFLGLTASSIDKPQNQTNQISFTVSDASDAVIPDAEIILIDRKTKRTFKLKTDRAGFAEVKNIPFGKYDVKTYALGFETTKQTVEINKKKNLELPLSITLKAGTIGEVIFIKKPSKKKN